MSVIEIECRRCFNKVKVRVDYKRIRTDGKVTEKFTAEPERCDNPECGYKFNDLELAHIIHEHISSGAIA